MKGISILGIFGIILLLFGSMSFAAPNVYWASPTPDNATDYYGDALTYNLSSNESMGPNTFINIDGTNYTCTIAANNLSCSYTLNMTEKIYGNTYDVTGYANITTYVNSNETRTMDYHGCGNISGDQTLEYDVGSDTYPDEDCFTITADNTSINCDGYTITLNDTTNSNAISATSKLNITIEDCVFESGYRGVFLTNVNYSVITNNVFNNQTWDGIAYDFSDESNITYNVFNMDVAFHNDIYAFNCMDDCNGLNFFYNNMSNGEMGINTEGNDTSIWRNRISYMGDQGISFEGSPIGDDNTISDNEIYGCDIGILSGNLNSTVLGYNHMYNNTGNFYFENTQDVNITHMMVTEEFDRPTGGYVNYSLITLTDIMLPNSAYTMDWSAVTVTPAGMGSFLGKHIGVSAAPINMGYNETLIDIIGFTWTNGEVIGYDESQIELWGIDVNGTAVLLNNTPSTGTNSIAAYDFRMEDYDSLGLYYPGPINPNVPGNVSNAEALAISNNIVMFGVLFMILFVIVGSFGLSKFYNFDEIFVPLMVAVFLVILAAGLFL